jgi:hypothetical protein
MTIKTQGGKVITKGGKVSCECCGCVITEEQYNFAISESGGISNRSATIYSKNNGGPITGLIEAFSYSYNFGPFDGGFIETVGYSVDSFYGPFPQSYFLVSFLFEKIIFSDPEKPPFYTGSFGGFWDFNIIVDELNRVEEYTSAVFGGCADHLFQDSPLVVELTKFYFDPETGSEIGFENIGTDEIRILFA